MGVFPPDLTGSFSLESERQQVSLDLQKFKVLSNCLKA